jgi:hypothetical protein
MSCGGEAARKRAEKLDETVNALRKIESAVQVGVNNQQYTSLVVEAKAKVDLANDLLPNGEFKTRLNSALDCYLDAGKAWAEKLDQWELLDVKDPVGKALIEKYSLQSANKDFLDEGRFYTRTGVPFDTALQTMWEMGRRNLSALIKLNEH